MKKRLIGLSVYTVAVVGISFLLQNQPNFDSILYLLTAVVFILTGGLLFSGSTNQKYKFIITEKEYEEEREKNKVLKDLKFVSIFTYLYLVVPFLIAIYLFAN